MTKISTIIQNELRHLPPSDEQFARQQAKSRTANLQAASTFIVGQSVALKNNRHTTGQIVAIDDTIISIEINGSVRKFKPVFLVAT